MSVLCQDGFELMPTALGLILESRVDMGCDTDFAMYYSRYFTQKILLYWLFKLG